MSFLEPTSPIATGLLLHRIEQELGGCRALLVTVENAVETLLQCCNVALDHPLHIVEMQNIDLLDQIIADVMLCLQDLAGTEAIAAAPGLRLGEVTRRLRLAALRSRLAGCVTTSDSGDGVELFGP